MYLELYKRILGQLEEEKGVHLNMKDPVFFEYISNQMKEKYGDQFSVNYFPNYLFEEVK
jgi:hypothetical protein